VYKLKACDVESVNRNIVTVTASLRAGCVCVHIASDIPFTVKWTEWGGVPWYGSEVSHPYHRDSTYPLYCTISVLLHLCNTFWYWLKRYHYALSVILVKSVRVWIKLFFNYYFVRIERLLIFFPRSLVILWVLIPSYLTKVPLLAHGLFPNVLSLGK